MFVISASALESLSPEDAAAAAEGMAKINAMDDLINSGADAVSDPDGALMVTSAINSIIGGDEGASDGSVGLEVADKAVKATEVIWKLETFSTALSVYYISICLPFCNKKCTFWLLGAPRAAKLLLSRLVSRGKTIESVRLNQNLSETCRYIVH